MSQENVEMVRAIYADWERGDFSRADWADPAIEYTWIGSLEPGTVTGLAEMAQRWGRWLSAWGNVHVEAEGCREIDAERVLLLLNTIGRGKTSGVELEQTHTKGAVVFHVQFGKVTRLVQYWDRDRAFADLGLEKWPMSQENVEIVRRAVAAINDRDLDGYMACCSEHVELRTPLIVGVYEGRKGIQRYLSDVEDAAPDYRIDINRVETVGPDQVLASIRTRGTGRATGIPLGIEATNVYDLVDGQITRVRIFLDASEALKAVGLEE